LVGPEKADVMLDLFGGEPRLERLDIEDAEVWFARHIELGAPFDELLREFADQTPWRHEEITIYGKRFKQPRLTAWYGDAGTNYSYSGMAMAPLPWTPMLLRIREKVQAFSGEKFNSVLLNHYRDHRDSMGFHSDDEKELGPTPIIASVSIGATRTFILKHKTRPQLKPVRLDLPSGCFLVMKGLTQKHWKHGIDKQTKPCGPRVNLTFRRIEAE
jgi:alkylated DNA repair dioxygenase AlkB